VYLDGLLKRLRNSGVGYYIGNVFVGALAYAEDIALLTATASAMHKLLRICENYGTEYSVVFLASKSVLLYFTRHA